MGREECPTLRDSLDEIDEFFLESVGKLLAKTGVSAQDVDVLVVNASMFVWVPSLASRIVNYYKMRDDVKVYNLSGMGCAGSLISISMVQNIFMNERERYALVVTTESLSGNWYVGNDRSMILANILFRSGGSVILLTNKRGLREKAMLKLRCLVRTHHGAQDESYGCGLEMEDVLGRRGVYLSKSLPKVVTQCLVDNLKNLAPKTLPIRELVRFIVAFTAWRFYFRRIGKKSNKPGINFKMGVDHFCFHTGGKALIDGVEKSLRLEEYDLEPVRMSLFRFGNTSGSSIWYVFGYMEAKKRLKKGERVLMIGFGTGFKCTSCLWEVMRDLNECDDNVWRDCIEDYPIENLTNPYMDKFSWLNDENSTTFKLPEKSQDRIKFYHKLMNL